MPRVTSNTPVTGQRATHSLSWAGTTRPGHESRRGRQFRRRAGCKTGRRQGSSTGRALPQIALRGLRHRRKSPAPGAGGRPAFPEAQAELAARTGRPGRFAEAEPLPQQATERGMGSSTRHAALALALIDADRLVEATEQLRHRWRCMRTPTKGHVWPGSDGDSPDKP